MTDNRVYVNNLEKNKRHQISQLIIKMRRNIHSNLIYSNSKNFTFNYKVMILEAVILVLVQTIKSL
jgi:hypothetical protein